KKKKEFRHLQCSEFSSPDKEVFMESKGERNFDSINISPLNAIENKTGRFLSLSVLLHIALFASIVLMTVPPIEFPKKEIVELEVEKDLIGNTAPIQAIPEGAPIPETKGAAPTEPLAAAKVTTPISLPPLKTAIAPPPTSAPVPSSVVPVAPLPPATAAPISAAASPAALPETLDDIQTPPLETSEAGEVPLAQMDEKDLHENFEKVDQAHHKAVITAKKSLDEEADKAAAEGDEAISEMDKETQDEAIAAALAAEKRRARDAAAIAAAEASEKAAADRATRLAADEGEGTGSKGSPAPTKEVAGIPGGVRSLEQLRQMAGNKFPQYDKDERLARQEGKAIFYAYVNKDGSLSQFKLGESSGYRNLDTKTLAALKKWKFHPGQEGWVEMPFKWTLTGEAMEAGGQLRNSHK
ncbi:MAG TPA: TonB family protein, partial [Pseudobdellovibrionaceae bacterium]